MPSAPPSPSGEVAPEGRLTEWLLRGIAATVMLFVVIVWGSAWWADHSRWTALLLMVSEAYTLGLVIVARRAQQRDLSPLAMVATVYATISAALLLPDGTVRLVPEWLGASLQLVSIAWQFTAKVFLGRSFGLLPAQRGLVMAGPYRVMRHPIYFGYLVGHVGFLLANFSLHNMLVLLGVYVAQVVRIVREETVLAATDPAYNDYRQRVRWRLLPGVF